VPPPPPPPPPPLQFVDAQLEKAVSFVFVLQPVAVGLPRHAVQAVSAMHALNGVQQLAVRHASVVALPVLAPEPHTSVVPPPPPPPPPPLLQFVDRQLAKAVNFVFELQPVAVGSARHAWQAVSAKQGLKLEQQFALTHVSTVASPKLAPEPQMPLPPPPAPPPPPPPPPLVPQLFTAQALNVEKAVFVAQPEPPGFVRHAAHAASAWHASNDPQQLLLMQRSSASVPKLAAVPHTPLVPPPPPGPPPKCPVPPSVW
jgi:hypothetical protein